MDSILGEFAKYGFGGLMCGVMLWILLKDNNRLKEDADKDNEWKINTIQKQTEASFTLAAALTSMTQTMQALVQTVNEINGKVSK